MKTDFIILTNANGVDTFYWKDEVVDTLPKDTVAFKVAKYIDGKMTTTDYKIGFSIDKPMRLLTEGMSIDIKNNNETGYAIYTDGNDSRVFNVGPTTALVDSFYELEAAFVAETKQSKYVRG